MNENVSIPCYLSAFLLWIISFVTWSLWWFAQGTDSGVDTYFGLCTYPGQELRHRIDFKVTWWLFYCYVKLANLLDWQRFETELFWVLMFGRMLLQVLDSITDVSWLVCSWFHSLLESRCWKLSDNWVPCYFGFYYSCLNYDSMHQLRYAPFYRCIQGICIHLV